MLFFYKMKIRKWERKKKINSKGNKWKEEKILHFLRWLLNRDLQAKCFYPISEKK